MTIIEGKRYDLSQLYEVACAETGFNHGVERVGVWVMKSGRVIVGTYSVWESGRHDGRVVGRRYHFADADEIAALAAELGDEKLLALVPVAEDA